MAKRKFGRRTKRSAWKMVKGVAYTGAIAAPMYIAYKQGGGGAEGVKAAALAAAFVDPATNKFSLVHGAQIWTPVAALAVTDLVTSKMGLQRRIATGVSSLLR